MRKTLLTIALLLATASVSADDSIAVDSVKKRPWTAAAEVIGITGLIIGYNNSVLSMTEWSKVSFESIKRNATEFKWWWDEDYFYTNTLEHPLHGYLYYASARENGLGIGTSAVYSAAGSLLWEIVGESELPSYNDMIITPIGGVTIGESLHRISDLILDDGTQGTERLGREVLAAIVNPVRGLNRLLYGDAWRVKSNHKRKKLTFETSLSTGYRVLDVDDKPAIRTSYLHWNATYGDPMGANGNGMFDYFDLDATAAFGNRQMPLNYARITSQLWRSTLSENEAKGYNWTLGLYNHFLYNYAEPYADSKEGIKKRYITGYSEVGAIGPGVSYSTGQRIKWQQQLCVNGIIIGATPMDLTDRQHSQIGYSWGSGYGAKLFSQLRYGNLLHFKTTVDFSQLFTWKGYDCNGDIDLKKVAAKDVQGEAGNTLTLMVSPSLALYPWKHVGLEIRGRYMWHKYNYLYHTHHHVSSREILLGLNVRL